MPGIVFHGLQFGRGAKRVRDAFGSPLVIGRKTHPDMAIVEDGIIGAIGLFDLVERLRNEEGLQPIARHESQGAFEKVQTPQSREFIQHQQDTMLAIAAIQLFSQPSADLIQHEAHKRFCPADV